MQVTIEFFGHYSDLYPEPLFLSLSEGATVRDIVARLIEQDARLARIGTHCRFAIDAEYAGMDDIVSPESMLAVLPPMSGG